MTQALEPQTSASSTRKSVNTLTKYVNLASAGLSELHAQKPTLTKAPPPEIIVREHGFAIRIDDDVAVFDDPSRLMEELNEIPEKRIDLVFEGRSALDLSFVVPNGPFNDLEAMIDTEIAFKSPFQREQCIWFWTAKETADLDWQVEAAIVLNSSVDWVLEALNAHGKIINTARRPGPQDQERIAVYPSWLKPRRNARGPVTVGKSLRLIPPSLRLPSAAFGFFVMSAIALAVALSVKQSAAADDAAAANQQLAERAAAVAQTQALRDSQNVSNTRVALVGQLAMLLPDGVWLEQISIDDDRLTITGFGPSAAEVTRLLSELEVLSDIQFGSPVTRDNTQNLERFRIDATVTGTLG
ncbi:PilN domain-containing protein [Cognatiyoonia sp. IB215446]|uniref:PilN domain-containing protein n=1 Tax=Cognatiyoonia sp. IB215446 TaxID=3097355 RepID=UPI002A123BE1|nr:PilN domain-containing protein [Cognatiyoonia sp. IB215446]MDX8350553.1 PilN domain-containing protein [Cognatiyoonia sp. IB215446]